MAKAKIKPVKDHSVTLANKKARLARHLKAHPNDAQSANNVQHNERKKPFTKGSAPEQKHWAYDEAGQRIGEIKLAPRYTAKK